MNVKEVLENDPGAYYVQEELLAPLRVLYNSLQETGDDSIANGRLLDTIRQVTCSALGRPALPQAADNHCIQPLKGHRHAQCAAGSWQGCCACTSAVGQPLSEAFTPSRLDAGAMLWYGHAEVGCQAGVHSP